MTMLETIRKLQSQGHEVEFYVRKDGGILVKRIDNERYPTGASGNARARELAGTSLSEARTKQLKYATRQRKGKKTSIDEDIEREFQRVKKKWSKVFRAKKGKPHPAGYFGKGRIRYALEHYGKEEALRRIREAERYASGIAYSKNVQYLVFYIKQASIDYKSPELAQLARDLEDNAYAIEESWILPAYEELYKLNDGIPPNEVARKTRIILRL